MPRIPTYDNYQTSERGIPSTQFNSTLSPDQASIAGRQMVQTGQAVQQAAGGYADLLAKQMQEANQLRVDAAINKRNEVRMLMLHDPKDGLLYQKGINALERPDGMALEDEYADKYKRTIAEIEGSLGNDAQKQAFRQDSDRDLSTFYGTAVQHRGQEFKNYALSVREGTIKNRVNQIGLEYDNPAAIDESLVSIRANAMELARLQGRSAAEAEADADNVVSGALKTAVKTAIEKGNVKYADGLMKKYAKDMKDPNDLLEVNGVLTKELDAQIASETVNKVMQGAVPRIKTSDSDRAFNIALQTESGGRQFGKDGQPLTSSAGAIGIAQVMPTTAPEAAKLAGLEWDENRYKNDPEYNKALGKAYFNKQLRDFDGNIAQAYAAYNAGPGATQAALAKAEKEGGNWLSYLPQETQAYVDKNMKAYGAGAGQYSRPSLLDLQQQVRDEIGTASPDRLNMALKEVERQYDAMTKAIKQQDEMVVSDAMRLVIENGGSYTGLPASVRGAIPPAEVPKVMDFAAKIAKGEDVQTDWSLYYQLKMNSYQLGEVNLMAVRNKLSDGEFKELVNLQNDARSGKDDSLAKTRSVKEVLDQFMRESGIDPTPKDDKADEAAKVGKIWRMFEQRVREREKLAGKPLSQAEMREEAARMFATVDVAGAIYGTNQKPYAAAMTNDNKIEIPATERAQIVTELKAAGLQPTDNVVEMIYLRKKGVMR